MTQKSAARAGFVVAALLMGAQQASATEGYFLGGYGATQTGLAGAGVANSTDAMALTLNPAGLVDVGREFQIGLSFFGPTRSYDATGTGFVAPGSHSSSIPLFLIPNVAYSQPIDGTSAWGVAVYGNGGMNTLYNGVTNLGPACTGAPGPYCAGKAGVNLSQGFLELGYSKRIGSVSIGIAPVLAVQVFSAEGLAAFRGFSADGAAMTNNGADMSEGFGLHAGAEWRVNDAFRLGLAGATPTYMSNFSRYQGLFADQGSFNIPGNVTVGAAYDIAPTLTVMADYKHIFYSSVGSIGNSSRIQAPYGSSGGPGFGWSDVDVLALGVEWKANPQLTLRAGYEFNTNPVKSADVTLGLLAPGVTTSQFSAGMSYRVTQNSSIDLAGYYAPTNSVSGPEVTPGGVTPGSNIKVSLGESQVTVGWTYHFDADAAPVKAKY